MRFIDYTEVAAKNTSLPFSLIRLSDPLSNAPLFVFQAVQTIYVFIFTKSKIWVDGWLVSQMNDDSAAGARAVATTVDLCKNGTTTTTTTTMNLAPLDPASAADDQPASTHQPSTSTDQARNKILYGIDDCPSWYLCVFLGLQVILFFRLCRYFKKTSWECPLSMFLLVSLETFCIL